VQKIRESLLSTIEFVDAAKGSSKPERTGTVFINDLNVIVTEYEDFSDHA